MIAARASWSAVQRKAKKEWLELMADDIAIEDPIGESVLDPSGKGHCGKQAVSEFFDKNIAPGEIEFEPLRSFTAGAESAHLMTLTKSFPNGTKMIVTGIFTYRVNEAGKLTLLRGYWDMSDVDVIQPS